MSTTTTRPETIHDERYLELLSAYGTANARHTADHDRVVNYNRSIARGDNYYTRYLPEASLAEARSAAQVIEARNALTKHDADYTGWSRYFLVVSSAGLVHRSMNCSTCNKGRSATQFALLPSFSGLDHKALVEVYGPALCSVCFPDAPTSWTDQKRFPTSLAAILLEQGEEAFRKAHAEWEVKQASKAAAQCPGSGTQAPPRVGGPRVHSDYRLCPHCGEKQSVVSGARFRKHKGK